MIVAGSPRRPRAAVLAAATALLLAACGDGGSTEGAPEPVTPAGERGRALAERSCVSCHSTNGARGTGPTWLDLAGSEVELTDGRTVVADEDYLRRAIVDPRSEVVDGFSNIMPVNRGLSDDDVDDLIAYIQELSTETRPAAEEPSSAGDAPPDEDDEAGTG
jgi:mono/diheme cytochrome c family protein